MKVRIFWVGLLVGVGVLVYYYVFTSPASNYKVAVIETAENGYLVTVKGKRVLMSHDLFSLLSRKTYVDSCEYHLPRDTGTIKADEFLSNIGFKRTGEISIHSNKMNIELYLDNVDNQSLEAESWNGEYDLEWTKK